MILAEGIDTEAPLQTALAMGATIGQGWLFGCPAALDPDLANDATGLEDPLFGESSIVVQGPHFAGALVAMDQGGRGADFRRGFDFALTYDRELVIQAANSLLTRVLAR